MLTSLWFPKKGLTAKDCSENQEIAPKKMCNFTTNYND